jgi:hypothetical protein
VLPGRDVRNDPAVLGVELRLAVDPLAGNPGGGIEDRDGGLVA